MPQIIAVGFKTRLVDGMLPGPEGLTPPANYKDAATIAKWRAESYEKLKTKALLQRYFATFDSVTIHVGPDDATKRPGKTYSWDYRDQSKQGAKQPAPMAIWATLKKNFPDAWPNTTHPRYKDGVPPVIFIGFDTRVFIKILGAECSKPANWPKDADGHPVMDQQAALPLSLWYANSEHRDIEKAVMGDDCPDVEWPTVLKHFGLSEKYAAWKGPHQDPVVDAALTLDLASYMGMLTEQ